MTKSELIKMCQNGDGENAPHEKREFIVQYRGSHQVCKGCKMTIDNTKGAKVNVFDFMHHHYQAIH